MKNTALNAAEATPAEMNRAVNLFKVLSHPDRLRLACALGDGRVTTQKELVEEFGWPQSTAARHISALRSAGLITAERDGTEIHLRLGNPVALHLLETVCDWVRDDPAHRSMTASPEPSIGAFLKAPSFRGVF
ncbi:MAG TPA: metalloregulator ArsR/SmtB family transcription factor [Longimicrobiales bacterium]|nr:metalloregulator ArsR/SmtB family transcription factor [Longimicrobiales bacterium]